MQDFNWSFHLEAVKKFSHLEKYSIARAILPIYFLYFLYFYKINKMSHVQA